jgi:CHASE1-domain containing sensor protein
MVGLLLFLLFVVLPLVTLGVLLARWWRRAEFARLAELRADVRQEIVTMQQIARVHDAFFAAREAMRSPGPPLAVREVSEHRRRVG